MNWKYYRREMRQLLGVPRNTTSHNEKLLSALGAAIGIFTISGLGGWLYLLGFLDQQGSQMVVASMGASAVLLFSVPHGALSQPWALVGGHLLSAFIGVSCFLALGSSGFASALAVGLSVGAMYYLRCIHPPGGATALTAVIGGSSVNALGYQFILFPVVLNVLALLTIAFLFNFGFKWRRYPAHLYFKETAIQSKSTVSRELELTQEDLSAAIQKHDSFIDITEEGLTDLLELAKQHAEMNTTHPAEIIVGKSYSNGKLGRTWSVRQVLDSAEGNVLPSKDQVIYKVVAGEQLYDIGICLRSEFRAWARFEVVQKDKMWVKVD